MAERGQVQPLASPGESPLISNEVETSTGNTLTQRRRCIKCCTIITFSLLLIIAILVLVLIFTVFKTKDPIIHLNGVTFGKPGLLNGKTPPPAGSNISIITDVSVKNPSYSSFRYGNTTTPLFYRGAVIGEARAPPGVSKARRTMRMNVTVEIFTNGLVSDPMFARDLSGGVLEMRSYTRVGGKVKILNVIKKHVVVKMNCSFVINMTSVSILHQKCKQKAKF